MAVRYPPEVHEYIAAHAEGRYNDELAEEVNRIFGTEFTAQKMNAYKGNHHLHSGLLHKGRKKGYSDVYPLEIVEFIHEHLQGTGAAKMAEMLNEEFGTDYTESQLKSYYGNHHLNCGLTGHFEKGHVPPNKGKKGYCPPGSEKGWFRKGSIPKNHREVGSERVNTEGYVEVKVAEPNKWRQKQVIVWEEHNGPVPKGNVIVFLDRNKQNTDISNLRLISRGVLAIMNHCGFFSDDPELTESGIRVAELMKATGKAEREAREKAES